MWSLSLLLLAHQPALLHTWEKALQSCPAVSREEKRLKTGGKKGGGGGGAGEKNNTYKPHTW